MTHEKLQLEPDEIVLIQVRKHWFVLTLQIIGIIIFAVMPTILYGVFSYSFTLEALVLAEFTAHFITLYAAWLLVMWMFLFNIWTNYYLDVWTITNKRLIAVDQKGFFFRTTASFRLERLQDIIVTVNGLLATLLKYGTLEIQTAGIEKNFVAYGLPNPSELKALILSATDTLLSHPRGTTIPNPGTQIDV